jgi:lambda family phage tail tape measure protein
MANEDLRVRIAAQVQGLDQVESLKNAVRQLQSAATPASADLQKLKNAAMQLGSATNRTESDLRKSIGALRDVRSQLSLADGEYRKITATINKYQAQLDKATGAQQRQGRGAQLGQTLGAVAASGVFGGPEGLVGAGIGAFFGPGGALAGGAIGAQTGMVRQQIAGMADYAASITKTQIALRGIVGSQAAYNSAVAAAAAATRELNIPQQEATRGLTRLSAAILGAGGTIGDSTFAFRAMSEAIKATGGDAQQVDGALLALTQVFSKGKVSAEELNQIAERLPGTFTLFAQAAGKTGPELQKALQQGQVGLGDLMKFLMLIRSQYGGTALAIAGSTEEAGARLTVAIQEMQRDVGVALQPLGAQLQESFTAFIKDVMPAVIGTAKALAGALQFFTDNEAAAGLATFALKLGLVAAGFVVLKAAIAGVVALNIGAWFATAATGARITGDVMAVATGKAAAFFGVLKGIGAIGIITVTIDLFIRNFAQLMAAKETLDKLNKQRDPVGDTGPKLVMTAERRYTGASREKVAKDIEIQRQDATRLRQEIADIEAQDIAAIRVISKSRAQLLSAQVAAKKAQLANAEEVINLDLKSFKTQAEMDKARTDAMNKRYATANNLEDKSNNKAAKDAAALAAEQQRLAETVMQQRLRIEDTLFKHQVELDRKRYDLQKQLNDQQTQNRIAAETGVQRSVTADFEQLKQRLREITERQAQANDRVRLAEQALKTASAMASVTTGGPSAGMAGIYRQGSIGPTSTGPHFDIKRSDGGFYGRTALDKYVSVNGRPLSSGVTVPGGEYGARRSYGGHAGRDYAFGAGAGLSLMGGAQWVGNRPGTAHGDETAFRTPDGKVYKILHGKFEQAGVAAQQRRGVKAEGTAGVESIDLQAAQRERQLEKEFEAPQRQEAIRSFILQQTDAIREQNATMQNSIELEVKRASLLGQGYGPERIESMMKVAELEQLRSQRVAKLGELARSNPEMTGELTSAIGEVNAEYTNLIATIERLYEIQSSPQARLQQAVGAVRQELTTLTDPVNQIVGAANAIGSSFGSAFKGLVSGSMSAKEALASFFQSTADYFLDMASKIITQWITMTILNSVLKLFPGGAGAAGGGLAGSSLPGGFANPLVGAYTNANGNAFAANGIVPYAKGGIVNSPTLFKFAKGGAMQTGIMGEAGAEAVMPLKRGPDGKLGVAATGGGGVNVVVNVDAKGSAVQGDQGQGNELGRVIAGAVQAELIKQQRPGGLLTR